MWNKPWVLALVVAGLLTACGASEEKDENGGSGTNAAAGAGASGGAGTTATAGTAGTATATAGTAGTAGAATAGAAGLSSLCPEDPGTTECGGTACTPVSATLAALCNQTCCTTDGKCGTINAANTSATCTTLENTSSCPDEVIMGNDVPGCCVDGTNECGVRDILTGSGSCVGRTSPFLSLLATLTPINCDGTTPEPAAGAGGAGGTGGAAGASAGTDGAGTDGGGAGGASGDTP